MFEIFVKLARGETRLIEVESSESIYDIKTKIQALEGVHPKQQVLIWEDKALYDGRTISSYNIQKESTLLLILRHGAIGGTTTQQTMIRESDPFQTKGTASAIMQEWKQKASQYAFDDDLYIVDPQAYYNHLDSIERTIVHGSEFYRSRGVYDPSDDTLGADNAYEGLPRWFPRSSGSKSGQLSEEASNESEAGRQEIQLALLSLQKSYAILYKVQRNLDHLIESGFAKSRFSLLVGHPEHNLAEIVQIPRFALDDLSVHIEAAIKCISYDLDPSLLQTHLRLFVEIRVRSLLECIGVSSDVLQEGLSPPVILTRCRMVVLLLDLALVCYVGSHGSRFDNQYLKVSTPRITANCDTLSFQCMLQPLACLSGFLDQKKGSLYLGANR
ncbi:uncharacterized protein BJX67DRAFT_386512 [Aspergillus lucknowensis]|uniref:Ubiquitin-like domain-containing protein n=1 Tax=Aspergillus lucknowensis TaxID=176173 RepID=A0ABR4L8V2_9EURO